ncbi:rhomboid family intramembrane serine protease [Eisenibacter elegans]|jgi:membrane associated rhomboid family serine protease|uniref:rhomboid family intramembrane serine protease n=1 Tax=Eisenibacter elegans TaxID=997 RepID=UPI00040AA313|nr:rhomboid family intramembrane serine protease [Eisenibacter elegans]
MNNQLTPVVRTLLILNVGVFALQILLSFDFVKLLGLRYFFAETFAPYQYLSYMFVHGSLMHIFGNMFGLFIFGPLLEHVLGSRRFLMLYFITGIGAGFINSGIAHIEYNRQAEIIQVYQRNPSPEAFVQYMTQFEPHLYRHSTTIVSFANEFTDKPKDPYYIAESQTFIQKTFEERQNIPMVGASGAVFGILVAFAMIFPNLEMMLLFLPVPIKAKYFVLFYVLLELYLGFEYAASSNVAHFAHVGGALVGFILIKIWQIPRKY